MRGTRAASQGASAAVGQGLERSVLPQPNMIVQAYMDRGLCVDVHLEMQLCMRESVCGMWIHAYVRDRLYRSILCRKQ